MMIAWLALALNPTSKLWLLHERIKRRGKRENGNVKEVERKRWKENAGNELFSSL